MAKKRSKAISAKISKLVKETWEAYLKSEEER